MFPTRGHYLIAATGTWLVVLGVFARLWPRPLATLFRPLVDEESRTLCRSLMIVGVMSGLIARLHGIAKLWMAMPEIV